MAFKLPSLLARLRIVNPDGTPTNAFLRFFNIDFSGAIERQEAAQDAANAAINALIADLAAAVADIVAAQAAADAAAAAAATAQAGVDGLEEEAISILEAAQIAQATGNAAQATADEALGGGSVAGSASNPAVDVVDGTWVLGPQIDLTGVVAGDLTITGSGPQQDADATVTGGTTFQGEFRVVEVVAAVDTVLYTANFNVTPGPPATVGSGFVAGVAAFTSARATTGAVSYRIDARRAIGTAQLFDASFYVYARRAA